MPPTRDRANPPDRIKRLSRQILLLGALLGMAAPARGGSTIPLSTDELIATAAAVFRGTVVNLTAFQDPNQGAIHTRAFLRVDEGFKGKLPVYVKLVHAGGYLAHISQVDGASPQFTNREECLVFVNRRADGTLFATQGSPTAIRLQRAASGGFVPASQALLDEIRTKTNGGTLGGDDVTDQGQPLPPAPNLLSVDVAGIPSRFTAPDRGERIPYIVDLQALPAGISHAQALAAVSNALATWSAASSAQFTFVKTQNLGIASASISTDDGVFRIQLHDLYNYINEPNVLGKGGRYASTQLLPGAGWGLGGKVAGREFQAGSCGFVVLKHTNSAMQTLSTFNEVVCHEIGHALGLAHTSEATNESNPLLKEALMYYRAHADGRGASLNSNDTNSIREAYPNLNTPPYSFDRVMDITTQPVGSPNIPGINEIALRGYDLQNTSLTLALTNATADAGDFALTGSLLKFAPSGFYGAARLDPASLDFYDIAFARFSDGTHSSPYVMIRTISLNDDQHPIPSDGIPDAWMTAYFGNSDPTVGPNHGANADADGDKLSNLNEYRTGMDPTSTNSAQRITVINSTNIQWQAKAYELYELLGSTNLTTWTRVGNPILPTNSTGSAAISVTNSARQFFKILKVP